jgi:hypothetical protein
MTAVTFFSPDAASLLSLPVFLGVALALLLSIEIGYRMGRWHQKVGRGSIKEFVGIVDAPILALLGLLIGFTFFGAAERFDRRRDLIVEETNHIGTAYLRLDLLRPEDRDALRSRFKEYLDSRIHTYAVLPDVRAAMAEYDRSQQMQAEIWTLAIEAAQKTGTTPASMQLVPALNAMIDITTTRVAVTQFHPPRIVFVMLAALSLIAAMLAGYQMSTAARRSWFHVLLFVTTFTLALYVILDLEYPRLGLIRVDAADTLLKDLRSSWGP